MSTLDKQVRLAQRRLWFNRWLTGLGWMLLIAAGAWTGAVLTARLIAADWPLIRFAELAAGAALLCSIAWMSITAESRQRAAVAVDEAAGLRERVSSSLYCAQSDDPFARAVVEDAQRTMAGVSARKLIPIRWSRSLNFAFMSLILAAGFFWLFPTYDLLGRAEAKQIEQKKREDVRVAQAELAKPVTALKEIVDKHADLKSSADLASLEKMTRDEKLEIAPDEMRREALKKIDRLSDQLRDKANSDRYASLDAMKKMLSQMGSEPADPKSVVGQLTQSLQSGDFAGAQEAVKKMQEQLAKRERNPETAEQTKQVQQQLENLAKKLEQMEDKQTAQKLKESGVSEQDVKRVLDALAKKDSKQLEQLAKQLQQQLQKQGVNQQQIKKMMDQLKKNQQAAQQCNKMGKNMSQAAKAMKQGNGQQAQQSLQKAQEQLSEMEKMSQEMSELETQMSQMDEMKDELGKPDRGDCEMCKGTGQCNGQPCGNCKGKPGNKDWARGGGRGSGLRARADGGKVDFVKKKADVKLAKGDVIGQWFVKGKQEKGESKLGYTEAAKTAERDATDAINKEQVPRIYHGPIKTFFDRIGDVDDAKPAAKKDTPAKPAADANDKKGGKE